MPQQIPQGLDPTAFLTTKAIKQTETSGSSDQYTKAGGSGEYGAYQFTEPTWDTLSKKYLGQVVPLKQSTPDQQNEVAYKAIAEQLAQGKTQSQVASWWNSGKYDPNATGTGTNKYGVSYDVPGYVNKVKNNYQQIQQQFSPSQSGDPFNPFTASSAVSNMPTPGKASLANVKSNLSQVPGQLYNAVTSLPGNQIGQDIGSSLAGPVGAINPLLQGNPQLALDTLKAGLSSGAEQNKFQNVGKKTIGDIVQSVATPATLALGGGTGASVTGRIVNAGLKYGIGGALTGGGAAAAQNKSAGQIATQAGETGLLSAGGGIAGQALAEGATALSGNSAFQNLINKISPKLTKAVGQQAFAEGRVTQSTPSILFGTKPDVIDTPDDVFRQGATITRLIPNEASMSTTELASTLKTQTDSMAQALSPQLKQVPINKAITGDIFSNARAVNEQLVADADATEEANVLKRQKNFDGYLNKLQWDVQDPITGQMQSPTPKNADDLWEVAKDYDASVPQAVKSATPTQEKLYQQKLEWLQRRQVFRNALITIGKDLPTSVGQTFSDMHDMYDARQTMIKNYTPQTKGTPGLVQKATGYTARQVGTGLGIAAGAGGLGGLVSHLLPQTGGQ